MIVLSEVGPRGGLRSIGAVMPLAAKGAWTDAEAAAGVREIDVGSFVSSRVLPQVADTAALVAHARSIPGPAVAAPVPNLRGARAAIAAGAHKLSPPFSMSETHPIRDASRTHAAMIAEIAAIRAEADAPPPGARPPARTPATRPYFTPLAKSDPTKSL